MAHSHHVCEEVDEKGRKSSTKRRNVNFGLSLKILKGVSIFHKVSLGKDIYEHVADTF